VPGYEMIGWNGVFVASGTPSRTVDRLAGEIIAIVGTPEVKAQLAKLGAEPVGSRPDDFAAFMTAESARWGKIITERGIKPE
jgi:tripartite-type tricarboxylate transporter receptor subunit TctC